jgi:hypothetical protein
MHAEKCPVCGGSGQVSDPACGSYAPLAARMKTCHGCNGKGWVEVSDCESFKMITPITVQLEFKDDPRKYFSFGSTTTGVERR